MANRKKKKRQRQQRQRQWKKRRARADNPLVGYVARRGVDVACDGDACIVAGSREAMAAILDYHGRSTAEYVIEKAYAAHLLQAIGLGGAYALDEAAYGRFLPAAQDAGLPLSEEDFSDPGPTGIHLVRVGFL